MKKIILVMLFMFIFSLANAQKENHPKVVAIYPNTDSIPVNILRFYVEFSVPMQELNILNHIQLRNEEGKNITGVFFENQYELWNENRTKVTILIDPGRVKLGLLANNKMGRAFDEGKKYSLTIDSLLLDFNDQKLSESFTKTFITIKEDSVPPNPALWELFLPIVNTNEVFFIDFKDKLDHISAQTLIKIIRDKKEIKGTISFNDKEQKYAFTPAEKWKKGKYKILINYRLEDIAANSVNQTFDHKPSDFKQKNNQDLILTFNLN